LLHLLATGYGTNLPIRNVRFHGESWRVSGRATEIAKATFMCRFSAAGNDEPLHALWRPAAEKRQGTKSRAMVQRRCRRRYGDLATGYGLRRLERSAC